MERPSSRGLDQQAVYALIARLAGQANILTIPRLFIDWTGDHISALLLSQIIYWSSRTADPDGWFYKSAKEWESELGISDYQLARATKKLADAGVATKLRKVGGAPTLHYRLDQERFLAWISEKLGNGFLTPPEADFRETGKSIPESVANALPGFSGIHSRESAESLTETTTETTGRERGFEISKAPTADFAFGPERDAILAYLADFARELGDTAPLASSVTRAAKLYRRSGLGLDAFVEALYAARAKTKERTAAIKAQPVADGRAIPIKPKMAYFFAVLEDLVGPRGERSAD